MDMNWFNVLVKLSTLIPGQHVRVSRGLYFHHGIYLGDGRFAELSKPSAGGRLRVVTAARFLGNGSPEVVTHEDGLPLNHVLANVRRAPAQRPYNLFDWNCEHFATWCSTHRVQSRQVDAWNGVAAAVGAFACVCCIVAVLDSALA